MVDVAKVKIFGMDMGTFRWDEAYGVARFEYDRDFIATGLIRLAALTETPSTVCRECWPTPFRTLTDEHCSSSGLH